MLRNCSVFYKNGCIVNGRLCSLFVPESVMDLPPSYDEAVAGIYEARPDGLGNIPNVNDESFNELNDSTAPEIRPTLFSRGSDNPVANDDEIWTVPLHLGTGIYIVWSSVLFLILRRLYPKAHSNHKMTFVGCNSSTTVYCPLATLNRPIALLLQWSCCNCEYGPAVTVLLYIWNSLKSHFNKWTSYTSAVGKWSICAVM